MDWARNAMADLIDAEVDLLLAHRETLDLGGIEADRAGAAGRSAFDPSKGAVLARRYEAAAERAVYRALNELRRVEAEAAAGVATPGAVEADEEASGDEAPGSFGAEVRAALGPASPRPIAVGSVLSGPSASPERTSGEGWPSTVRVVGNVQGP